MLSVEYKVRVGMPHTATQLPIPSVRARSQDLEGSEDDSEDEDGDEDEDELDEEEWMERAIAKGGRTGACELCSPRGVHWQHLQFRLCVHMLLIYRSSVHATHERYGRHCMHLCVDIRTILQPVCSLVRCMPTYMLSSLTRETRQHESASTSLHDCCMCTRRRARLTAHTHTCNSNLHGKQ
jgi:hypothetical protein